MVPILLLTGFLGSGKTTLLNRLLQERPATGPLAESAGKLALIVNEFGDVGIDGDLLPDEMTRQIEIKGGRICCRLATRVRLAAVITVVDALEHEKHRPLSPSVDAQVEYADVLVITKLDLAGNEKCAAIENVLRETNDVAPILEGNTGQLVSQLWQTLNDPPETLRSESAEGVVSTREGDAGGHHFHSVSLPVEGTLDFEILSEELEQLPPTYIRIKGIAMVVDGSSGSLEPRMIVFHRVGARVSAEPAKDDLQCRIVAIGTHVDPGALASCVRAAMLG